MSSEPVTQEHFPDLVLCPSPGYDLMELEKRGFQGFDGYLVGLVNGDEFKVNFGGELNEDPANISRAIVHVKTLKDLVSAIEVTKTNEKSTEENNEPLFHESVIREFEDYSQLISTSMGFCFRLSSKHWKTRELVKNMKIFLNRTFMHDRNISVVNLHFEEKRNRGVLLKLSPFAMTGDNVQGFKGLIKYKIKIKKHEDKKFCKKYENYESFEKCNEYIGIKNLNDTLGCLPISFTNGTEEYCKGVPNMTEAKYKDLLRRFDNYVPYEACMKDCSSYEYNAVMVKYQEDREDTIELVFDESISITKSRYEFTFLPILTTVGGHIGVCRTVIWVGFSFLGAKKIFNSLRNIFKAPLGLTKDPVLT